MNTVSVKKTSTCNIQAVEIQITLQDGHHFVNYNKILENLQAFVSSRGFEVRITEDALCFVFRMLPCRIRSREGVKSE